MYEIVVGRNPEDTKKYGTFGTAYIGKHIVGLGEDAHTTSKILLDLVRPHVMLICGKRGSGKSYSAGVIAEEMAALPEELRKNLAFIIIDPMGIYWSMKNPNDKDSDLLRKWDLKPKGVDVNLFIPGGKAAEYESAGIMWDNTISLPAGEFSAEDWAITFNIEPFSDVGVLLARTIKNLKGREGDSYSIKDIIGEVESDKRAEQKQKDVLRSLFENVDGWGIFGKEKISLAEMLKPGSISVIDISHYEGWTVKNLFVSLISKKIYQTRLIARKDEEAKSMMGEDKSEIPMIWLMMDEAHQFLPNNVKTASTDALLTLVKLGREPGISTVFVTQQPYKLHPDALSQTDIVLSHRLTSEQDVKALETVMQTYLLSNIQKSLDELPKWKGTAIMLDDNSEKLYSMVVRPRASWHAGGSPIAIKNDQGTKNSY
ncbi:MAG: ATP-binding protein [Candidatus Aenigmarchaeota archaeon]|nr:ATP-binding protein [Candidatus Aenigmarchaeota archaeon]